MFNFLCRQQSRLAEALLAYRESLRYMREKDLLGYCYGDVGGRSFCFVFIVLRVMLMQLVWRGGGESFN